MKAISGGWAVLLLWALLTAVPSARAERIDAGLYTCAELEERVRRAGRLDITAVHVNPHSSGERLSTNTFVAGRRWCTYWDEWPTPWRIRAKGGAVCTNLSICLPRNLYDGPFGRWW